MRSAIRRPRPVVLVVLDGLGHREETGDNAVRLARTPVLSELGQAFPHGVLAAAGPELGLQPGQPGSSEVAHIALGSGRAPVTDRARIDQAIRENTLSTNPAIRTVVQRAKDLGGRLHLIGLVSEGGVHSSFSHLLALIELAKSARVRVVIHALLDGRDTAPGTAGPVIAMLEAALAGGAGRIGTVAGRFWGMDRNNHWDRIAKCYRAIMASEVRRVDSAALGTEESYAAGKTDEFVEPFVAFDYPGVSPVDAAIHFNFRADRALELSGALAAPSFDAFARKGGRAPFAGRYATLSALDDSLGVPTALSRMSYPNGLAAILSRTGYAQLRCAESEKARHATTFFNGGHHEAFDGEERRILPSVAAYDKGPEMAASSVALAAAEGIRGGRYDFVLINFANPDVVGHSGDLRAAVRAVEAVDAAVGRVAEATRSVGGALIVTGSHGNCEVMKDPATGEAHTRHTANPVSYYYVEESERMARVREGGTLCDVAPTVLELLDVEKPTEMTGQSLLVR
jgi:2,3-bisphosphoglycerate-independent phosphoglycerate mutase